MESRRQKYYKNFTNVDSEREPAKKRMSSCRRNRKRKENSSVQDDTHNVTKLRRANTAEYKSLGLSQSGHLDGASIQVNLEHTEVHLCSNSKDVANSTPIEVGHIVNQSFSPIETNVLIDISHRSENLGNSSSLQLDSVYDDSLRSKYVEKTPLKNLIPPLDITLQTKDHDIPQSTAPDVSVNKSLTSKALDETLEMYSGPPNKKFPTPSHDESAPGKSGLAPDHCFPILDHKVSPPKNPDSHVDDSFPAETHEKSLPENADTPVDDSLSTETYNKSLPVNAESSVDQSLLTAADEDFLPENQDPPVDEEIPTIAQEDRPIDDTDPPVEDSSAIADLENTLTTQSSFQIVTTHADIHDAPCRRNPENINNYSKKNKMSREEEIQICLKEIKEYDDNIKPEISECCEMNEIVIELELEKNDTTINEKDIERNRRRKEKKELKYRYIDFLSDDECFVWSSSSWDETNKDTGSSDDLSSQKSRKKKQQKKKKNKKSTNKSDRNTNSTEQNVDGQTTPESNEKEERKRKKRINKAKERSRLRNSGQEYVTKTGNTVEAKNMKENPCQPGKCPNRCYDVTEEKRRNIFDYFWNLSKEKRNDWIVSHSKRETIKRKRTKETESRRQWSHSYFINDGEGQKQVCLKFLLNTLDIRQKFVHFTLESSIQGCSKDDRRGKHVPYNKTSEVLMQSVRSYIEHLPAVPSHYCRKNTKKCYLPQDFKNLSNLYKLYKQKKESEESAFVGEKVFKRIFNTEYNISFHVPRKDKCQKCIKYENDQSEELKTEKEVHMKDKNDTYARFKVHQEANAQDSSVLCVTFDLQKVLNTPYGQSMLLYYSRKLAVYNLTFYESKTREGSCYTWNETEGKRGANEVCTILSKYIEKVDSRGTVKHLLLYCDSCPGQNKNRVVMACLHQILQKCSSIISIQINYLLPGHTYMPVDSMHAVIEKSVENTIIWAPSQWPTVFALARKSHKPYEVTPLTHKDFEAWGAATDKYFKGNLVGKVSKIRTATVKKSNLDQMYVKYSMAVDAQTEIIEINPRKEIIPKKIYKSPLPISKQKYCDLLKLCTNKTIPEMYRTEYIDLPNAGNVQDVLAESDVEDEED